MLGHSLVLDRVRGADRTEFNGWVYNLETRAGWYIANGIVAHNCRCELQTDPQGIARLVRRTPTRVAGTKVSATVYVRGPHVLGAEFGETYPLPSGAKHEDGTYFMRRTARQMRARLRV